MKLPAVFTADGPWGRFRRGVWIKSILLAVVLLGAKWGWIERFGGEVPYMDQWDAEAMGLYEPMLRGEFTWSSLFTAHNEHRIVATKAWAALLFLLGDSQWDPRVQTVANALLHVAFFGLLAAWCARRLSPRWHPALFALLTALGAIPFAYENMLWRFQSSIYFVLLFGWMAGAGLLFHPTGSWRWCGGAIAGVVTVLSFGSGGLVGIAVIAAVVLRARSRGRWPRGDTLTALVGAALVGLTWFLKVDVPGHHFYRADSWTSFSVAVIRLLSWPDAMGMVGGLILWTPTLVLGVQLISGRRRVASLPLAAVFLGTLAAGEIGVLSVFRARDVLFSSPSSRYLDLLALGLIAGLLSSLVLLRQGHRARIAWQHGAIVGWLALALVGLGREGGRALFRGVETWRDEAIAQRDTLRTFLHTDDAGALAKKRLQETGYPSAERLAMILRQPELRAALPPALQAEGVALKFAPDSGFRRDHVTAHAGAPVGLATWSNRSVSGVAAPRDADSLPFTVRRGHVEFSFGISAGAGEVAMIFVPTHAGDGHVLRAWGGRTDTLWFHSGIKLAPGQYVLRVHDERAHGWAAVTSPREMSGLGSLARTCAASSSWLSGLAVVGLMVSLAWPLRRR